MYLVLTPMFCNNENEVRKRVCLDLSVFYSLTKIEDRCVPQIGDGRW